LERIIHIVSLVLPWPTNYSGAVDIFYRIQALHQQGAQVHLHCLCEPVPIPPQIAEICASVTCYPTKFNWQTLSFSLPYTVRLRASAALTKRLLQDEYPIIFEGINACHFLYFNNCANRNIYIRLHAVKHVDYAKLAKRETNIVKRLYYKFESGSYIRFKQKIAHKTIILSLNNNDVEVYKNFGAKEVHWVPFFNRQQKPGNITPTQGSYCLYHGDLTLKENITVVEWLIKHIFCDDSLPFVVAGKSPSKELVNKIYKNNSNCVIESPTDEELDDLIQKAQINIVPTMRYSGINYNLIQSLFLGKHCLTNKQAVNGIGLAQLCHVVDQPELLKQTIQNLFTTTISATEIENRQQVLSTVYNNQVNGNKLIQIFWAGQL
jgi:hypothetical protein